MFRFYSAGQLKGWLDARREEPEQLSCRPKCWFEAREWTDNSWELIRQILAVSCAPTVGFCGLKEIMPPNTLGNFVTDLHLMDTPLGYVSDALQISGQFIQDLTIISLVQMGNTDAAHLAGILELGRLENIAVRLVTLIEDAANILERGLAACKGSLKSVCIGEFNDQQLRCALQGLYKGCSSTLQKLDISCSDGNEATMMGLAALLSREDCSLTDLRLDSNRFGDKSMMALASALRQNRSIQTLTIVHADFGDASIPALASALSQHRSLRRLEVSGEDVTKRGWETLFVDGVVRSEVLEESILEDYQGDLEFMAGALASPSNLNHKLHSILVDLEEYETHPEAWCAIEFFVDLNSCGAKTALLWKQSPMFPISLWPLVMARLQQITFTATDDRRLLHDPTDEQKASRLFYTLREAASVIFT